jgi:drug/metabolite transporter (DMT)-like permease
MTASRRPDPTTLAVFAVVVIVGGLNPVAVRYSDHELAPFWGASVRLVASAALLLAVVLARGIPLPRGRALLGVVLYGLLGFGAFFGFLYWGLVNAPAAAASVALSLVPLMTLILAPLHGLERFRWQALAGAVVSVGGVAFVFADQLDARVAPLALIALLLGALALSESTIVVKRFPRSHPAVTNAIGLVVGAVMLLVLSAAAGETWAIPHGTETLLALAYLVLFGSVLLFMGFLYVLNRWTASAASYQILFMPLVTLPAATFLRHEPVSGAFIVGAVLVLAGVYLGALAPPIRLPWGWAPPPVPPPAPGSAGVLAIAAADGSGQVTFVPPTCP